MRTGIERRKIVIAYETHRGHVYRLSTTTTTKKKRRKRKIKKEKGSEKKEQKNTEEKTRKKASKKKKEQEKKKYKKKREKRKNAIPRFAPTDYLPITPLRNKPFRLGEQRRLFSVQFAPSLFTPPALLMLSSFRPTMFTTSTIARICNGVKKEKEKKIVFD